MNNQNLKIKINKVITKYRVIQGLLRLLMKLNNKEAIRAHYICNLRIGNLNNKLRELERDEERGHFGV